MADFRFSSFVDRYELDTTIKRLTGVFPDINLDPLSPLGSYSQVDPIRVSILDDFAKSIEAAFMAGVIAGADPRKLLLVGIEKAVTP